MKFDRNNWLNILKTNPMRDSHAADCCLRCVSIGGDNMGADPTVHSKEQDEIMHEQRYTVEKMTFIVEPRFQTEGNRTLGTVLLNLMQYETEV